MFDERTDRIARAAARLLERERATDINHAIRAAAEELGLRDAPRPGPGLVRRHAQAMSMQALGEEGYRARVRAILQVAEDLMTVIEQAVPDAPTLLAGRAARGNVDGGVTLHVRVYTDRPIGELAEILVEHGYEEPEFETAETRFGRLDRMRLDEDGEEVVLTRCLPAMWGDRDRDLFVDRARDTATVGELRERLS